MIAQLAKILELAQAGFTAMNENHVEHYAAIGRFILSYGSIDAQLAGVLQTLVNPEDDTARVLVGEMRTGDMITAIRQLSARQNLDAKMTAEMEELFSEINRLKTARNDVAHRSCMVKGDNLAFHNAPLAKTDSAILVNYYSIGELNEFSRYANRLAHRVVLLGIVVHPPVPNVFRHAIGISMTCTLYQSAALALLKDPNLSQEEKGMIQAATTAASSAVSAYADAAKQVDTKFSNLLRNADKAVMELAIFLSRRIGPSGLESREIPARLRKGNRNRVEITS